MIPSGELSTPAAFFLSQLGKRQIQESAFHTLFRGEFDQIISKAQQSIVLWDFTIVQQAQNNIRSPIGGHLRMRRLYFN